MSSKVKMSLASKLTLFIAIAVLGQTIALLVAMFGYFFPGLEKNAFDVVDRGAVATAEVFSSKWNYDVFTRQKDEVAKHVSAAVKGSPTVAALGVFALNEQARGKEGKPSKGDFELLAKQEREKVGLEKVFARVGRYDKSRSWVDGKLVFVGVPIKVEEDVAGYLIYVESAAAFTNSQSRYAAVLTSEVVAISLFVLMAVFVVGRQTARPLRQLAGSALRIAQGNLTEEVTGGRGEVAEISDLTLAVSKMSAAIKDQVRAIAELTGRARRLSQDVSRSMSHLSTSASEQAAAVSQTATTVEEMEKTGKSVAQAVKRIVDAAERSAEASGRGREAVELASAVILKIKEDSGNILAHSRSLLSSVEEIGNIINSVNAIAEQSKILAVNASIEAAKAGEFGAGFAVVAQEVKNLAGQSKEATEQITQTLTGIRHAIEGMVQMAREGEGRTVEGVTSVANTGAIVNDLNDNIQESSVVANEIDASVSQQSMGLSQIASAMEEINTSASENQEISLQIEHSALSMGDSLAELDELVARWRIENNPSDASS